MNLYIWKDVLRNYSPGMIVALAPDLETALSQTPDEYVRAEMGRATPEIINLTTDTQPRVFWVHGGG